MNLLLWIQWFEKETQFQRTSADMSTNQVVDNADQVVGNIPADQEIYG
jgi:hypothetical protein